MTTCRPSARRGTRPSSRCRWSAFGEFYTFKQLEKSDQLKQLVAMYIQDTDQKIEPKSYTKLKRVVTRHLEQKTREKHFSTRDPIGGKPNPFVLTVKRKKRKRPVRLQSMGPQRSIFQMTSVHFQAMIRLRREKRAAKKTNSITFETQVPRYRCKTNRNQRFRSD